MPRALGRLREELRENQDRFAAMRVALRQSFAPIVASGSTVILGVLCLLLVTAPCGADEKEAALEQIRADGEARAERFSGNVEALMEQVRDTHAITRKVLVALKAKRDGTATEGQLKALTTLTTLSTINLELLPAEAGKPLVEEWRPAETIRASARALSSLRRASAKGCRAAPSP